MVPADTADSQREVPTKASGCTSAYTDRGDPYACVSLVVPCEVMALFYQRSARRHCL